MARIENRNRGLDGVGALERIEAEANRARRPIDPGTHNLYKLNLAAPKGDVDSAPKRGRKKQKEIVSGGHIEGRPPHGVPSPDDFEHPAEGEVLILNPADCEDCGKKIGKDETKKRQLCAYCWWLDKYAQEIEAKGKRSESLTKIQRMVEDAKYKKLNAETEGEDSRYRRLWYRCENCGGYDNYVEALFNNDATDIHGFPLGGRWFDHGDGKRMLLCGACWTWMWGDAHRRQVQEQSLKTSQAGSHGSAGREQAVEGDAGREAGSRDHAAQGLPRPPGTEDRKPARGLLGVAVKRLVERVRRGGNPEGSQKLAGPSYD